MANSKHRLFSGRQYFDRLFAPVLFRAAEAVIPPTAKSGSAYLATSGIIKTYDNPKPAVAPLDLLAHTEYYAPQRASISAIYATTPKYVNPRPAMAPKSLLIHKEV